MLVMVVSVFDVTFNKIFKTFKALWHSVFEISIGPDYLESTILKITGKISVVI